MNKIEHAVVVVGGGSCTTPTPSLKSADGGAVELIRDRRFDLCVHRRGDLSHTIKTVVDLAVRVREAACLERLLRRSGQAPGLSASMAARYELSPRKEGQAPWKPASGNVSGCEHRDGNIIYAQRAPRPT